MVKDRKLGDEWEDWNGELCSAELDVETGKRLFLGMAVISILILATGISLFWYLIEPRIEQLNENVASFLQYCIYGVVGILLLIFFLTVLSIIVNKNLLVRIQEKNFSITFLTPVILALGRKFGVSYDKMGNSFIKVSNSLTLLTKWKAGKNQILILLPRCLMRPIQKQIETIAQKYQCLIYTVPGGSLARKLIAEHKPWAVIGVACERDLMSGIRDVTKIPVIGIPNQRPEGPCKNTTVDYKKIEDAIQFLLGMKIEQRTKQLSPVH